MSQNNIGEFIQQSRKAKGFTQKDLGDRIGVSDKPYLNGKTGFHLDKDTTPFPR